MLKDTTLGQKKLSPVVVSMAATVMLLASAESTVDANPATNAAQGVLVGLSKRREPRERRKSRSQSEKVGPKTIRKTVYRVKSRKVDNDQLYFFRTRTAQKEATIRRIATRNGLDIDRISR